MATWPSGSKASTANVDQGTDSPATARADLKQSIDNQNSIIDMFLISDPQNNQVLKYNTTNSRFELSAVTEPTGLELENIVEDTTPQLGGALDTNGNAINFGDNDKATFGDSEDLWLYHDGTTSYLYDRGTGNLRIITNSTVSIDGVSGGEFMATFVSNGAVSLYFDGSNKFQTTSTGVNVTGNIAVSGTVDGVDIAAGAVNWNTAYSWGDHASAGYITDVVDDTTPQLGGNLDIQTYEITTSVVDGGLTLRANGGGIIEAISDGFIIGDGVSAASLTTNGATNIVIDTNDGVDTGSITIATGVNGDITLAPNGTGTVIITGNLQIDGTTTTVNSTTLDVDDINITLAKGAANAAAANGGGITVEGPTTAATITYSSSDDSWNLNKKTSAIELQVDNINVNGNAITSTDTNGNITVTPNGTGSIVLDGQSWPQAAPATNDQYLQGNLDGTLAWTDRVNAKTIYETVKNVSGGSLSKGTPVYQSGVSGLTITVAAARADDTAKLAIGVLDETLADQAEGRMLVLGEIKGVNTSGFTSGDKIYLGETGGYTNTPPTGSAVARQFLGIVNRVDASNGSGYITGTLTEDSVKYTGSGFELWTGTAWSAVIQATGNELENVVEDTTPQLGGNLDVNGQSIVSVSNGNISITPNGTGKTIVSRLNYNEGIYEIGTGQSGTITPDAANGNLQYIEISGNITINALNNPVAGQAVTIVIDSLGAYTLTSSMLFAGGDKTLTDTGVDILSILYLGNSTYLASLNKDFS